MTVAADKAYAALREQILSGALTAGDRLKERSICADLGLSRTPVREALRKLQADGLVEIEPRRGGVVAGISPTEAEEIYSLGILLESYGASLAAKRINDEDILVLEGIIDEMETVLEDDTLASRSHYVELDSELHRSILKITGNRRLNQIIGQIVGLPVLVQAFTHYSSAQLWQSMQQHRVIVAALKARDSEWAESAMRAHILSGRAITFPQ
jgi:DNA-binding GntR family transcriptional regulator